MIEQNGDFEFRNDMSPLLQIRERLEMTREQFAVVMMTTASSIYRWEKGLSEPNFNAAQMKAFQRVLNQLGKDISDLPDNLGPPSMA